MPKKNELQDNKHIIANESETKILRLILKWTENVKCFVYDCESSKLVFRLCEMIRYDMMRKMYC